MRKLPDQLKTDEQVLMYLVDCTCSTLADPREETANFSSFNGFPNHLVRRAMRLIVDRFELPMSVDDCIFEHRNGGN